MCVLHKYRYKARETSLSWENRTYVGPWYGGKKFSSHRLSNLHLGHYIHGNCNFWQWWNTASLLKLFPNRKCLFDLVLNLAGNSSSKCEIWFGRKFLQQVWNLTGNVQTIQAAPFDEEAAGHGVMHLNTRKECQTSRCFRTHSIVLINSENRK